MLVLLNLRLLNGYWVGEHPFAADSVVLMAAVVHREVFDRRALFQEFRIGDDVELATSVC